MASTAILSPDRIYRYVLRRQWSQEGGVVAFLMLNPSTADEEANDPTINKCINYAKAWGYGGVVVANLYAFRSPSPEDLAHPVDPIGPENDAHLLAVAREAKTIVCAWGVTPFAQRRHGSALALLRDFELYCLEKSKAGYPKHPLYLKGDLQLVLFQKARRPDGT